MSQRRILILSKGFPPDLGGIETYAEQIAKAYLDKGFATYVITQFQGPIGWQQRQDSLNVFNTGPAPQFIQLLRFIRVINTICRDIGSFSAIHATTWRTAIPALISRANSPLCITVHGREVAAQRWPMTVLCRAILSRAKRVLVISAEARRRCTHVAPILSTTKAVISWNGITPPSTSPRSTSNTPPIVLTACRLTSFKNVMGVLDATAILNRRPNCPPFRLLIAGDGPQRPTLEDFARATKLQNVTFLGTIPRKDMPALLSSADIFLHPQISIDGGRGFESFCLAVADAMAAGLPTIAGSDGAPAEYIEDGVNGVLVNGRSSPDIANALQDLLADHAKRIAIGDAGAAFAKEHFSWSRHVAPVVALTKAHP